MTLFICHYTYLGNGKCRPRIRLFIPFKNNFQIIYYIYIIHIYIYIYIYLYIYIYIHKLILTLFNFTHDNLHDGYKFDVMYKGSA